jgi:hypothetical protein
MKLCIDVNDKYESVFNKLNEKQKERLIKGLSAHANAILATLENTSDDMLDSILKVLTSAMLLLGEITGNETNEEENEDEG